VDPQLIHAIESVAQPNWTGVAQAIGSISTLIVSIVGFLILIRQLKQFNQNMQYDAYSKHVGDYSRVSELLIEKPQLNDIYYSKNPAVANLRGNEKDFYNFLALVVGFYERLYVLRFRTGWIDEKAWSTWERWLIEQWFPLDLFELFWRNEKGYADVDFAQYIDNKYEQYRATSSAAATPLS
jgi:hypothetical protein